MGFFSFPCGTWKREGNVKSNNPDPPRGLPEMTAQINDTCSHRQIEFAIARISGSGLFDPATLGIQPVGMSTACWRGYIAHYSIVDGQLLLTSLMLGLPSGQRPELFGVSPIRDRFMGYRYEGLQVAIPFVGRLLL